MDESLWKFQFYVRTANCLANAYMTLDKLLLMTKEDLLKIRGIGKASVENIEDNLREHGYSLKPSRKKEHGVNITYSIRFTFVELGWLTTCVQLSDVSHDIRQQVFKKLSDKLVPLLKERNEI